MTWLRLDDDMLDDDKWRRAIREGGDTTFAVWFRLSSWCSRRLTDGEVPADLVAEIAQLKGSKTRATALRALIDAELIARRDDGGLTVVGYLKRNPSRVDVLAERARRAEAQKNRRNPQPVTGHAPRSEPQRDEVPSRPVPSRPPHSTSESDPSGITLTQSTRELGTFGAPTLKFEWDPNWLPTRAHQARGLELGLTDDDIGSRLYTCQHKTWRHGFKSEDKQFFLELGFEASDKKIRQAKEARSGANWEKPGSHRKRDGA